MRDLIIKVFLHLPMQLEGDTDYAKSSHSSSTMND